MFNKRKRTSRRWSVRAIEMMIVLVAIIATASVIFPPPQKTEIRIVEAAVEQAPAETALNPATGDLVSASYDAALDYMYHHDYQRSANLLEAITSVAQDHYWSHVTYSFVLYELGDYEEAMAVASKGIKIDPQDAVAWNNRCLLRALTGDLEGGLIDCNHSISVDPTYDYSYNNRCFILTQLGRLDEAERDCLQALENGHRMPEWVYTNLGRIALKRGLDHAAKKYFITALEHNPMHADAFAGLGDTMLLKASFIKALAYYETYKSYAGVHYAPAYDNKIAYVEETLAYLGEN